MLQRPNEGFAKFFFGGDREHQEGYGDVDCDSPSEAVHVVSV